ncbi:MAG: phenylalanine--tRNA ligase subunit beta [Candidatus Omnitrophica bacterium]|nr:phenylalanine--tRNA ligase subunit beta [Candidatus Omnitrophota bacterium]
MKISYSWLKEYIDIKESPERLAAILTNSGSEVKAIELTSGDFIMDIEITPNRSDCLNYLGVAREISALTGKKVKMPLPRIKKSSGGAPFKVDIKDKTLCPRYTARFIRNISVKESPEWLKKRIISMGLRPVNNVVDITNFVLFETGQPMHAFDYDKIKGNEVIIRRAAEGEKILSIDNMTRKLEKDMLIIADSERPIAVAGVMGGFNTEVSAGTKNILLESAYFNPVSVRRTSYKLALSSESSYRFERSVDPGMILRASDRAAVLIGEICGGKIVELLDKGEKPGKDRNIELRIERLNNVLNLKLTESYVKKVLLGLSLKPVSKKKGVIKLSIPSFRQDIKYEIDIIEEVARMYGYDRIGTTIPKIIPNPQRKPFLWQLKTKTRDILTSLGLNEIMTYGLTSQANLHKAFGLEMPEAIAVKNYLNVDQELMRPSILPGVLSVLSRNISRGIKDLKIFEIGNVYGKNYHYESAHLCIALTGLFSDDWQREKSPLTLFDLRGILDTLFSELGISHDKIEIGTGKRPQIFYDKKYIGYFTALDKKVLDAFDLTESVFCAEIDLNILKHHANLEKKFRDIPKYPSIKRDISLIAPKEVTFKSIISLVSQKSADLVENVELLDRYSGRQIPQGHQGLAFRIEYRGRTRTLTSKEVDKIHFAIRDSLVEKLKVTLR